jgi:hypothetical protein
MKIKLIHEWFGHKKGTVLDLVPVSARRLMRIGTAVSFEEGAETKDVSSPPKDKMVKRPRRKKSI